MHSGSDMEHEGKDILKAYEHLAEVTGRMRVAAAHEEWDQVIALESECASVYGRLASMETSRPFSAEYQRRKSELICKLLDDDAEIRDRVSGQLTRIWRMIDGRQHIDRISAAYGGADRAASE